MSHIYVNHINFEHELSNSFHDILDNNGENSQSIEEEILQPLRIYVNSVNFEIPFAVAPVEPLYIYVNKVNLEIPVAEEVEVPEVPEVVGGGATQRPRVLGGRPWKEETLTVAASAQHSIEEQIFVHEIIEAYADNTQGIETKVRRPIYKKPRKIEILSFAPENERTIIIPKEEPKINFRQKEEEELLLLGII